MALLSRPPVPPVPITEDGKRVSREWWRWFHDLFVDEQSTGNLADLAAQVAPPDPPAVGDAEILLRSLPGDPPALTDDVSVLRSIPGDPSCDCDNVRLLTMFSALAAPQEGIWTAAQGGTGQTSYTDGQLLIGDSLTGGLDKGTLTAGSGVSISNEHGTITISSTGSGGTVTSVSVTSANGFAGTVATPTTTPAITIQTTVTGLLLGNGTSVAAYGGTSGAAHQWLTALNASGAGTFSQPAFADISGTLTTATQLDEDSITLGSTAVALGATAATVTALTLSGGTLSGATTLPGAGTITSGGSLLLGFNTTIVAGGPTLQAVGSDPIFGLYRFSADINDGALIIGKSRGTTSTPGAVVSGDSIGECDFRGDDGSTAGKITVGAAVIRVLVDGAVSTGIVPGRIVFQTMNSGGTLAERMRLVSSGCLNVGNTTDLGSGTMNGHNGVFAAETIIPPTNVIQSASSNPAGTTNTTGVMMGLAVSFTPKSAVGSGNVLIHITGDCFNATAIADGGKIQIRTGTGAAPINGAALTGTSVGSQVTFIQATTADKYPFSLSAIVTGLVLGTAIWIDVSLAAVTGGTATIENVSVCAVEV